HRSAQLLLSNPRRGGGPAARCGAVVHLFRQRFHVARRRLFDLAALGRRIAGWSAPRHGDAEDELAGGEPTRPRRLLPFPVARAPFVCPVSTAPAKDEPMLSAPVTSPPGERLKRIFSYVKTYHRPDLSEEKLTEIFSRGNNRFLDIALPQKEGEQEYLLDWMFG